MECRFTLKDVCDMIITYSQVTYHPAKFGSHRHCDSGDMMILVCHMILEDRVTKKLSNFMSGSQSR